MVAVLGVRYLLRLSIVPNVILGLSTFPKVNACMHLLAMVRGRVMR